ncbi:hypothetical protein L7F22_006815 [Adiantum nelumboides]|nr:hypothetical protein [Adiantum nelumboides]
MGFGWHLSVTSLRDLLTIFLFAGHCLSPVPAQNDAAGEGGAAADTQALLRFKQTFTSGPSAALSEWSLQSASSNSCSWFGVTCSNNSRVTSLDLTGCGLVAPFPLAELAALHQLQELRLGGNAFFGAVKPEVIAAACQYTPLSILDLSSNKLSGSFPNFTFLQNCKALTYLNLSRNFFDGLLLLDAINGSSLSRLDLSHNNFSGVLASDIFLHCGALSWLDASNNSISGSLPLSMGQCSTLRHLNLSFNLLTGTIPPEAFSLFTSNLTSATAGCFNLTLLDLSANLLTGPIPASLSLCRSLRHVNLSLNSLNGHIPAIFDQLIGLEVLSISNNSLTGSIPPDFGDSLHQLKELDLSSNDLVGRIPTSLSSCSSLEVLNLGDNGLTGDFPAAIVSQMPALRKLVLSFNKFTGPLPIPFPNFSSLEVLDLSANAFTGTIPGSICSPLLRRLLLADNELSGVVPLESCSSLATIDVSCNFLNRAFPTPLPAMPNMREIIMWGNFIEQEIPFDICSATSQLWLLVLNLNRINGTIPPTLANCSSLEWLALSNNRLTGHIPLELGLIPKVNYLHIGNNSLSGTIPPTLGNCKYLVWLDLSSNKLEGIIPREITKQAGKVIKGTLTTDLQLAFFKYLHGDLCTEYGLGSLLIMQGVRPSRLSRISNLQRCNSTRLYLGISPYYIPNPPGFSGGSLTYFDVGHNKLTGTIPEDYGTLIYSQVLSVSHNYLTGTIPFSLGNLIKCSILHLDHNHLQGSIPPGLSTLGMLNQIDFSNNNLSGYIPDAGKLPTFPAYSFINNPYLCGTPLPPCQTAVSPSASTSTDSFSLSRHQQIRPEVIIVVPVVVALLVIAGLKCSERLTETRKHLKELMDDNSMDKLPITTSSSLSFRSLARRRTEVSLSINVATYGGTQLRKISYRELEQATKGFCEGAIIGRGGFGEVFRATLDDHTEVAVKKLFNYEIDKDFQAEIKTLGKIKHPNLVSLCGYCQRDNERLLIYEYMQNGSLDNWLHGNSGADGQPAATKDLSWESRKRIAVGTARGLLFLHEDCRPNIIHRDMKTANVLLDEALEAHVADFGMARLVSECDTHVSVSTLAGTPGYVPPEYGTAFSKSTKPGDVFSYGVVLLELVTGRRPTWAKGATDNSSFDRGCEEDGGEDLAGWVKKHVRIGKAREVLDKRALQGEGVSGRAVMNSTTSTSMTCSDHGGMPMDLERRESEMLRYLSIACRCVEEIPSRRPSIFEILTAFRRIQKGGDLDLL